MRLKNLLVMHRHTLGAHTCRDGQCLNLMHDRYSAGAENIIGVYKSVYKSMSYMFMCMYIRFHILSNRVGVEGRGGRGRRMAFSPHIYCRMPSPSGYRGFFWVRKIVVLWPAVIDL